MPYLIAGSIGAVGQEEELALPGTNPLTGYIPVDVAVAESPKGQFAGNIKIWLPLVIADGVSIQGPTVAGSFGYFFFDNVSGYNVITSEGYFVRRPDGSFANPFLYGDGISEGELLGYAGEPESAICPEDERSARLAAARSQVVPGTQDGGVFDGGPVGSQ